MATITAKIVYPVTQYTPRDKTRAVRQYEAELRDELDTHEAQLRRVTDKNGRDLLVQEVLTILAELRHVRNWLASHRPEDDDE